MQSFNLFYERTFQDWINIQQHGYSENIDWLKIYIMVQISDVQDNICCVAGLYIFITLLELFLFVGLVTCWRLLGWSSHNNRLSVFSAKSVCQRPGLSQCQSMYLAGKLFGKRPQTLCLHFEWVNLSKERSKLCSNLGSQVFRYLVLNVLRSYGFKVFRSWFLNDLSLTVKQL
jgi:hypothetical protein